MYENHQKRIADCVAEQAKRQGQIAGYDPFDVAEFKALVGYDPLAEGWSPAEIREMLPELRKRHAVSPAGWIGEAAAMEILTGLGDYAESQALIILGHSLQRSINGCTHYPRAYIEQRAS